MSATLVPKKPKVEVMEGEEPKSGHHENGTTAAENGTISRSEQEEALLALIEHRAKEVEHLRQRITYFQSQLDQAETRLEDSQSKLARLRGHDSSLSSKSSQRHDLNIGRVEQTSSSPSQIREGSSQNQPQSKPQLVIPAVNSKISQPTKVTGSEAKASNGSHGQARMSASGHKDSPLKLKGNKSPQMSSERGTPASQAKGTKRKFEQKEHKELIRSISSCSYPQTINWQTGCLISSQHKRKLRSLVLCPTINHLFVTSALDGIVNLWEVQGRGSGANLLSSTDCVSQKHRRWPEDIAWHPDGNSIFSVYSADGGDTQISALDLNKRKMGTRVHFLEEKPHVKGIINNIEFMPWEDTCFVTGGSDHAVVLWTSKDGENSWKPKVLHRNMHSSAVMGVAGLQQKQMVVSVGADKRIIGFDVLTRRAEYKHQIESKCMSVLPNPCDFNLFMVQTGTPEKQLRLFDIRLRQTELHAFGWKQESSESQSALINQAWSPDGLYLTSGSADPMIHIFDIRYISHKPSQSVRAHQKRVFKAEWHPSLALLISISSDLSIGLHKIV